MPNVYLIQQDTEHLYGEFLSSAVVVAESVGAAQKLLASHLREFTKDTGEEILWFADRLSTMKIGNNGRVPDSCRDAVICLMTGFDPDLPAGNYNPKKAIL